MGIDQPNIKATLFEPCEQGKPVDASRLQHHGLNLTLLQPLGQGVEISRKGPKALPRFLSTILWDGDPGLGRPAIHPGGMEMHLFERR